MEAVIPPSVQPLIDAYLDAIEPLRSHLYGIYIFGSIALGAFEELKSDIDIMVVTRDKWTSQELTQLQTLHTHLQRTYQAGKLLEVHYIPLYNLGKCDSEMLPYPTFNSGKFFPAGYYDINHITWWIVKNKSICLFGPEGSTLPFEVTWQDILAAVRDHLDNYWASKVKHPYLFLLDGWVVWAVTTLCRILTTIEEKEITTKPAALQHWRDRLSPRWGLLIDETLRIHHHQPISSMYRSRFKRMRETLAFFAYVRERVNKIWNSSAETDLSYPSGTAGDATDTISRSLRRGLRRES